MYGVMKGNNITQGTTYQNSKKRQLCNERHSTTKRKDFGSDSSSPFPVIFHTLNDVAFEDDGNVTRCFTTPNIFCLAVSDVLYHHMKEIFHTRLPTHTCPTRDEICSFIHILFIASQMEYEICVFGIINIICFLHKKGPIVTLKKKGVRKRYDWKWIVLSCLILSGKLWDDRSMLNIEFSEIFPQDDYRYMSISDINEVEMIVLKELEYSLSSSISEYTTYSHAIHNEILNHNNTTQQSPNKHSDYSPNAKKRLRSEEQEVIESSSPKTTYVTSIQSSCKYGICAIVAVAFFSSLYGGSCMMDYEYFW